MSDEPWDSPEESPEEQQPQVTGFEALPPETQAEIKKLRKENQKLREGGKDYQKELLAAKYDERVLKLIPPEITEYARQVELAEMYKGELGGSLSTETQADVETPVEVVEPPTQAEQQLATATGGPATGTPTPGSELSAREIFEIAKTDPAQGEELIKHYGPSRKADKQLR